jgi:hypothetical protein
LQSVLVNGVVSKYVAFNFVPKRTVFTNALNIFSFDNFFSFSILSSSLHEYWAQKLSSSLGQTNRYNPTDCFETFPFPGFNEQQKQQLETIGEAYHEHRKQLMLGMQLGLTDTYNLFHWSLDLENCKVKSGKVIFLKHLERTPKTISLEEAKYGISKLRELHVQMDEAVLDAYGWNDIALRHDFYEVDYLPENDRVRFTIHPDARKEVLKRLLELNHKIYEEEISQGLHKQLPDCFEFLGILNASFNRLYEFIEHGSSITTSSLQRNNVYYSIMTENTRPNCNYRHLHNV